MHHQALYEIVSHMINETCQDDWSELTKFELEVWDMLSDAADGWFVEHFR